MNTLPPPSLTSIRPGPRMISPPRISASHAAVASGSGLRKWTWSQVTVGILVSQNYCYCGVRLRGVRQRANLAAGHLQFHPLPQNPAAAILSGSGETIWALGNY